MAFTGLGRFIKDLWKMANIPRQIPFCGEVVQSEITSSPILVDVCCLEGSSPRDIDHRKTSTLRETSEARTSGPRGDTCHVSRETDFTTKENKKPSKKRV